MRRGGERGRHSGRDEILHLKLRQIEGDAVRIQRGSDGSGSGGENGFGISASTQQLRDESSASVSTKCRGISTGQPLLRSIKFFQIGRVDHGLYL